MPPTPIPAPAHPYYHQSPQRTMLPPPPPPLLDPYLSGKVFTPPPASSLTVQHAVPYPMMMPPPPPGPGQQGLPPPHGYDAGPQQQMGGIGHA